MTDKTVTIALAAWNQYQALVQNTSSAIWKIRTAFYAVSAALIATGYTSGESFMYLCVPIAAFLFLVVEGGYKRLQIQYIRKSIEIERTLTDLLVDEPTPFLPKDGIGTSLSTPRFSDLGELFSLKRVLFWFPYVVVAASGVVLTMFGVYK